MSDRPGKAAALGSGSDGRPPGRPEEGRPHGARPVSRRTFLKAAMAGGVAVGAASLGYWYETTIGAGPAPESFAPAQSIPPSSSRFLSRPDIWSPLIAVAGNQQASGGQIFLTPASAPGPVIVGNDGSAVWIHNVPGKRAFNLRMGTYKGKPVLTWFEGQLNVGTGLGEYVLMDETYREVARVRAGNGFAGDLHEFILTPEGTALFTIYARRAATEPLPTADGPIPPGESPITLPTRTPGATLGPSVGPGELFESILQEVDVATGKVLLEWHSADFVNPDESYVGASPGQPFDYFHINSIDVDTDGNLLISARHTCAVYKIDRHTGQVIWRMGGKKSDFRIEPGAQFAWQHDARRQPDGTITIFDDGSSGGGPPNEDHSRALVLAVDESARTVSLKQSYSRVTRILAKSQGSVQLLPNGNVFVGWGDQPYFTEFSADGGMVLDGQLPATSTSYRALRYAWHGKPADRPVVSTRRQESGTNVYASWNGATDVVTWVALGGDTKDDLSAVGSQTRTGFETGIFLSGQPRFVAVRAIAANGAILGQSIPIGV